MHLFQVKSYITFANMVVAGVYPRIGTVVSESLMHRNANVSICLPIRYICWTRSVWSRDEKFVPVNEAL